MLGVFERLGGVLVAGTLVAAAPGDRVLTGSPSVVLAHPVPRARQTTATAAAADRERMRPTIAVISVRAPARRRSVKPMPSDNVAAPTDQIESAEATLVILQDVLDGITADDMPRPTPCREFDVASLTDHLMNSITTIGGAAGAQFPDRDTDAPVAAQVAAAAEPTLMAWQRRGLDGMVEFGENKAPAALMAGILSIEFLVHAWDYAKATGHHMVVPDPVADYVLELTRKTITPEGRTTVGFDDPVMLGEDARVFERLLAFTGRDPRG